MQSCVGSRSLRQFYFMFDRWVCPKNARILWWNWWLLLVGYPKISRSLQLGGPAQQARDNQPSQQPLTSVVYPGAVEALMALLMDYLLQNLGARVQSTLFSLLQSRRKTLRLLLVSDNVFWRYLLISIHANYEVGKKTNERTEQSVQVNSRWQTAYLALLQNHSKSSKLEVRWFASTFLLQVPLSYRISIFWAAESCPPRMPAATRDRGKQTGEPRRLSCKDERWLHAPTWVVTCFHLSTDLL